MRKAKSFSICIFFSFVLDFRYFERKRKGLKFGITSKPKPNSMERMDFERDSLNLGEIEELQPLHKSSNKRRK